MRRAAILVSGLAALALGAAPAGAQAAGYAADVASTPGVAAHWRLGEPAGTTAADAIATATGTTYRVTLGAPGALTGDTDTAARFDGAGYVYAPVRPRFAAPYSVEAWFRVDAPRTNALVSDGTASRGYAPANGYHLSTASDGSVRFEAGMTGGLVTVRSQPVTTGYWHHAIATVDATAVTLYVDGAAVASAPAQGVPAAATGSNVRLGRATSGSSRYLRGWLDDVALYGAALDAGTVARHFALGADTRPPRTAFSTAPAPVGPSRAASFTFASAKPMVTYECRADAAGWAPCTSPVSMAGYGDGAHSFAVRARDRYGIVGAPAAYGWTVDTIAPDTLSLAILPSAVTPVATVSFASEAGTRFQCGSGGAWAACTSPVSAAPGTQISVRALDAAGNADPSPATLTVPAATASAAPVSALTGPSAAFQFWVHGAGQPQCSLDGSAYAACDGTLTTGPLAPGAHGLTVRAALPGGGVQTASTSWSVTLPAPRLVGVQFPVLVYMPPAKKIRKSFPSSRLPAVRFSLNVGASVRLTLQRTSGAKKGRTVRAWTVTGRAGANVSRLPIAVYRKLGPARYRITADAAGPAGRSVSKTVRFQVVRKRPGR
jgi:hypothetical protein